MSRVRVLTSLDKNLQRLGFLKRLILRARTLGNSSAENLGQDLVDKVTNRFQIVVDETSLDYARKRRIGDYKSVQFGEKTWFELQHLYLSDPEMPSATGNLLQRDSKRYPWLTAGLGLLKEGNYSINVRALSLLNFTSEDDQHAFLEYLPNANPLRLNQQLRLLLTYTLIQHDGEAISLLLRSLLQEYESGFAEADAARFVPQIYSEIIGRQRRSFLSLEDQEKIENLENTAKSVEAWIKTDDPQKTVWKHVIRFRLESMVDLGLLKKLDRFRFEYVFTQSGKVFANALLINNYKELDEFLTTKFSSVSAISIFPEGRKVYKDIEIIIPLFRMWRKIRSSQGYAPINELGLAASIESLVDNGDYFEISDARESMLNLKKIDPYSIRFTVDRRGAMAHVKFMDDENGLLSALN